MFDGAEDTSNSDLPRLMARSIRRLVPTTFVRSFTVPTAHPRKIAWRMELPYLRKWSNHRFACTRFDLVDYVTCYN